MLEHDHRNPYGNKPCLFHFSPIFPFTRMRECLCKHLTTKYNYRYKGIYSTLFQYYHSDHIYCIGRVNRNSKRNYLAVTKHTIIIVQQVVWSTHHCGLEAESQPC